MLAHIEFLSHMMREIPLGMNKHAWGCRVGLQPVLYGDNAGREQCSGSQASSRCGAAKRLAGRALRPEG